MRPLLAALALAVSLPLAMLCPSPARAAEPVPSVALRGALADAPAWAAYKARFVTETGRVTDTANGGVSHSEGQGYGLLLAVAADDRAAFERIWGWTRANLMVRDDQLLAWRWEPDARPAVADMNDAADGDLLVAWALAEAADAWGDPAHRAAGRRIAVELGRKLILPRTAHGPLLLPAVAGFAAEDRADGPVVNLSYWVFPAFARLPLVAPEFDWAALSRSGLALLGRARFGPAGLPSDWVSLAEEAPRPAAGFPATYGYDAIRIPLYLALAGVRDPALYAPFRAHHIRRERRGLPVVEVASDRTTGWFDEPGYAAVTALAACASEGTPPPPEARTYAPQQNYFPATLHLLARVAVETRLARCAKP